MFWAGSSLLIASADLRAKAIEKAKHTDSSEETQTSFKELKQMLKQDWTLCVCAILLMAGASLPCSLFAGHRRIQSNRRVQLFVPRITS